VGYFLAQFNLFLFVIPSIVLGVVESVLVRNYKHVVFHSLMSIGCFYPLHCVIVHCCVNVWFPEHSFNIERCIKYYLSNVTIAEVESRPHSHVREPPFYDGFKRDVCKESQYLYGIGSGGYRPVAYAPNYKNELAATKARIVAATPDLDLVATNGCVAWVKRNVRNLFPKLFRVTSVSFDEYIKNSNASSSVKRTLRRTMLSLQEQGIDENTVLSPAELYDWTRRKAFVKVENNVYRTPAGRKQKASRLIQGAAPEFICLVGPWMMAFQGVVKKQWSSRNFICFTSGVSSLAAASLVDQDGWTVVEDDIGAFDASVNRPWLQLELWLFRKFGCPRAVYDLIKANIDTHGVTSKGIKYRRQGMRKSGDPYTSVGNSLLNGFMHVYIYCIVTGKTVQQARDSLRMLVQGDDNLMRYIETMAIDWVQRMSAFGFTSEAVLRDDILDAEFCSNLLYRTDKGLVFSPKPGKVIAKLGYYINPPHGVEPASIVRGTALGLWNVCSHVPPLRAYLQRLLDLTDGIVPHKVPTEEWKMKYDPVKETPETWITLDQHYGWTYACQNEFEIALQSMQLGQETDHVLLQLLCDRDTSGPQAMYITGRG
jgi:hypothetical protein